MNHAATSPKAGKPTGRQALVMLGGGALLAASACYGAVGAGGKDLPPLIFTAGFAIGMLMALAGVILVVVRSAKPSATSGPAAPTPVPRPSWTQTFIMLASGAVLGTSSCFGFLETMGKKGAYANLYGPFATGFYIGCLLALGGLIMALIRVARSLMSRKT